MAKTQRVKPVKPYPSFPLTAHPNGQWCKKIRGKIHFFGVWADPQTALGRYLAAAGDLHAGRLPRASTLAYSELTIKDACNHLLNWQKEKLDAGEIGARWFEDCRAILARFANVAGKNRLVSDLRPEDFQRYRARLAKRLGVHALTRNLTTIRSVFKYAYDVDLIDRPIKFGKGFANPTAVQKSRKPDSGPRPRMERTCLVPRNCGRSSASAILRCERPCFSESMVDSGIQIALACPDRRSTLRRD